MTGEDFARFSVNNTNLDGEMPLVAETTGIWHWWPVNSHLMASEPERERESLRELY
jgi:hypothetical protein